MRSSYETFQLGFGGKLTPGVKWLLLSNGVVYLMQLLAWDAFINWFGLSSQMILHKFALWQFFTYMFLHGGFFHLFFNMFVLWIFGCEVERNWGTKAFLKYYFITGLGAGVIGFLFSLGTHSVIIGASGAIYGTMLAFAMMFPERVITLLIFFVLPVSMKTKHLVMLMAVISIFSGLSNLFGATDGVAHFAHLGGMLVGYLYLKADWQVQGFFTGLKKKFRMRRVNMEIHHFEDQNNLQKQVDTILDKINAVGYDNLTREEKKILKQASERLSHHSKVQ